MSEKEQNMSQPQKEERKVSAMENHCFFLSLSTQIPVSAAALLIAPEYSKLRELQMFYTYIHNEVEFY